MSAAIFGRSALDTGKGDRVNCTQNTHTTVIYEPLQTLT